MRIGTTDDGIHMTIDIIDRNLCRVCFSFESNEVENKQELDRNYTCVLFLRIEIIERENIASRVFIKNVQS
jgi:hypothetical protein